jgi:hypothetical protein
MTITNGIVLAPVSDDGIPLTESSANPNVTWDELKNFCNITSGAQVNFLEHGEHYHIWCVYKGCTFSIPHLLKTSTEGIDFETTFKYKCNIPQAIETRLSTCRYGRKLHSRFISFHTATTNGYNNDNYLDVDHADAVYVMVDASRNVTTDPSLCKETWIDWEPLYSYEVAGGSIYIPTTLPGDQDAWALHVIGAPDYPAAYGGSVEFIANPRLKWRTGGWIEEDESLNPVNVDYVPTYHFTKMRWIIKHPVGAQAEFQIHLRIFR